MNTGFPNPSGAPASQQTKGSKPAGDTAAPAAPVEGSHNGQGFGLGSLCKCGAEPVKDHGDVFQCGTLRQDGYRPIESEVCLRAQRNRGDIRIAELVDKVNDLTRHNTLLRASETKEFRAWQGDGEDHLESLVTPVLIPAKELRAIVDGSSATKKAAQDLGAQLVAVRAKLADEIRSNAAREKASAKALEAAFREGWERGHFWRAESADAAWAQSRTALTLHGGSR